ncbi:MAG: amino acid adenylation domain-containing protein, partial [Ruminococcaceae bacterium]|nr:amino acid adenylation domain-containing protein [Oscillospiraceae bacterium]
VCTQLNEILEGTQSERYSYENYINSEKEYLESKRYARDRQFFLDAFQQCGQPVMLSDKYSTDYSVEKLHKTLPKQTYSALRDYADKTELSEFVSLFGAFSAVYGKLNNCAESFFLGMPVLNRFSKKDMNTVGIFMNTVPVPVSFDYEKSLNENLAQIDDTVFKVFKHQKFNYNDTLNAINDEYGYNGKLFDCIVNYQPDEILAEQTMRSTDYSHVLQSENLHLFIHNRNQEEKLTLEYDYRSDVFSAEEIERFHNMFMRALNLLLTDDRQALKDISLLDEEEEKLLESFNNTAAPYDKTISVYDLFAQQAEKTPNKTALLAADRTLNFEQLKNEASRLAGGLIEKGIKKGDIVAFCLPRDSRLFCTMLGILQSGAAYLPLDPSQPEERIEYIINDSGAKLCITEDNYASLISAEALNTPVSVSGEDLCYCIYTSGSTGMPKGTLLTHRNVVNYVGNGEHHISKIIGDEWKSILSVTSVGFDIFVTESLLPLANGKSIVLADEMQSKFGAQLQEILKKHRVDVLQTTPSKMQVFLQNMEDKSALEALKSIVLGGETLNKNLVSQLKALTQTKIFNVYGPTETTVWVTCGEVDSEKDITIGKPIANTQIYIVDKYMKPVPIGVTGELCIAGDNVGKGYLNRTELTKEKFIDNPFGEGKLYKTGDLAYWKEDGNIAFVGRNDFQVKINGQRVELGEIEAALTAIDGIESAAVIVRNEDDRQLLCAFYTGRETTASELRNLLSKTLPRYMVPQAFMRLEEMPLNTSGKTDKKAFKEQKVTYAAKEYLAPETEEEKLLVSTAKQVLKAEKIGMLDNFFDLGGDSLKSIAWISLLEKQGYTLSPNDIFSAADMAELAEKLRKTEAEDNTELDYPAELPLTSAQKEIYTAQSVAPDKPVYNIPYIIKVNSLDVDKLQNAVNKMLERHEILRMRFEKKNGETVQIIDDNARCIVESIEGEITDFIRPFELSKAPLIRVGYKDNTVIFDLHHIVADGSSMPVFFKELNEYYMGREVKDSFVPYKYFAVTEKESSKDIEYWNNQFADEVPALNLRYDLPRPAVRTYEGKTLYKQLEKAEDAKVMQFCKEQNITPFVFYYGAFQILMHKLSSQEDIVVGTPMSSRTAKNLGTIGMFVHTLPLRCKPEGTKTVKEFLNEVRELSLEASQHTAVSPSDIAQSKGKASLFDVMFTYQTEEMTALTFGDEVAEIEATPIATSKFDIDFALFPRKEGNILSAICNTSLFREKAMEQMMTAYERILSQALIADKKLSDIFIPDKLIKDIIPAPAGNKINRAALEQQPITYAAKEYLAPETEEEKLLVSTAKQVLKAEKIGMLDNFFDLGGDSLKSIAWISLLEKQGYTLSPNDIFSAADMAELAEKLRKTEAEDNTELDYPAELPLTSAQKEIYTAQSVAPDKPVYNIPYIIKVNSLDVDKLQNAVNKMLERHEILRMRFEKKNGETVQIIDDNARCIVESIEGEITDFIRPFELSKAPLIRVGYKDNTVIFDLHHIVADGSSMPVFFKELNEYYMGREVKDSFVPYKYFAVTEKESSKDIEYWNNQFADEVPALNLRYDLPRPAVRTYEGKTLYKQLEKAEDAKVMQFCKEQNITPFVFYYGAFQILMHKLSSQEDIVVGTPMSSRTAKNLGTIGMFVHTLPLRCKPEGTKTVKEFLNEVRELSLEASQHTAVSPSDIAQSKGKASLFDVMFTYQTEEMTALTFGDEAAEIEATPLVTSKYDFDFSIYPRKDGNVLSATYNISLFNERTIEQLMKAYKTVLAELLNANKKFCNISIIDEEEEKLLKLFNNTAVTYDKTKSVYDLFEEQAKNNTQAYIEDNQKKYTLAELEGAASKVDAYIRKEAGNEKQVIGVICERSFDELAAIFGIIRGGNAYMPISPDYPKERIETMLKTSGCRLVIAQKKYCHLAENAYAVENILALQNADIPEPAAKAEDTLYVIYTSGSTGTPKGAMVSNRSAINRIGWMAEKYFDSSSVVMLKTPYTFDVSAWEILGFAMYGFSLYILPPDMHYSQKEVLNHIEKGRVTDLHFVPTVFEQFVSVLKNTPDAKQKLSSLKNVILSGESLPAKAVNELSAVCSGRIKVHNLYGPAECAIDVTSYDCKEKEADPIPIGKPIANTQIYIVDKYMKPVLIGVTGELCIAGDNVGQGYLNRPELTTEKFIDNPFGEGKLYKTGDLAYWKEDGNIVFVGRNDFQVKINGQRVELGEIEAALTAMEGIESAAVIVKNDETGAQLLSACYTGKETSASELRNLLSKTLPRYMIPQAFTYLEEMPLNASGKTDRKALEQKPVKLDAVVYEAPKTETEAEICRIFCEILNVERFGRNDNFYDFGGTSLQIVKMLSLPPLDGLSPSDFLADPTPAALAKKLDGLNKKEYTYVAELYKSQNAKKAVVLFPFAGGDASAYTALVAKAREEKSEIALYFVDWFNDNEIEKITEEIRSLSEKMTVCFYSHCAGCALAMKLLDRLNENNNCIKRYIAGANIPPRKMLSGFNIWKHMTNDRVMRTLKKAGLPSEAGENGVLPFNPESFRRHTIICSNYFRKKTAKTNVALTAVISKNDPLTKNYADAKALWQKYVKTVDEVVLIDTPSHYFQNTDAELLLSLFEKTI